MSPEARDLVVGSFASAQGLRSGLIVHADCVMVGKGMPVSGDAEALAVVGQLGDSAGQQVWIFPEALPAWQGEQQDWPAAQQDR